jgi:lipoprotein NlpD
MQNKRKHWIHKLTQITQIHWTYAPILTIIVFLWGCGGHVYHIVEPGETLYSISWMYGHDYRTVAQWNHIKSPYILQIGQRLRVAPSANDRITSENDGSENGRPPVKRVAKSTPVKKSVTASGHRSKASTSRADKPNENNNHSSQKSIKYSRYTNRNLVWSWPVKEGTIVQTYVANSPGKQGIDVTGKEGQTIYSASNGMVVYSGQGLPLYGKLIIIKHNETYLSAYAHNKKLLVKEGDAIKVGQPIALMGKTGSNNTKLHFEIRRDGKPVDPLHFLPAKRPN